MSDIEPPAKRAKVTRVKTKFPVPTFTPGADNNLKATLGNWTMRYDGTTTYLFPCESNLTSKVTPDDALQMIVALQKLTRQGYPVKTSEHKTLRPADKGGDKENAAPKTPNQPIGRGRSETVVSIPTMSPDQLDIPSSPESMPIELPPMLPGLTRA